MTAKFRNIAIVAHVDHGKTTLIDCLLQQTGVLDDRGRPGSRVLDNHDLERERGITILSKNTGIDWQGYRINIVDTPGHADFGGEVERVLSMVDSVLLLVDAVEGPMSQTRFVTEKAFSHGFKPVVVINKIDRPAARPMWVLDQTFELFDNLGASDQQLDFSVVYASALKGYATLDPAVPGKDMSALLETIVAQVPPPAVDPQGALQLQISTLDYDNYVGVVGIGRVQRGTISEKQTVAVLDREGRRRDGRILQLFGFKGLQRVPQTNAIAGELVAVTGLEKLYISDTICAPDQPAALPPLSVDEPTVYMGFEPNTSPLSGREGNVLTARKLADRLEQEAVHNVALRIKAVPGEERIEVAGRGELHLGVLIETIRREGYELAVSRPRVILHHSENGTEEPFEALELDIDLQHQGAVMESLGERRAELKDMRPGLEGWVRLSYVMPTRGLIGYRQLFSGLTSGTGVMNHRFSHYGPYQGGSIGGRRNGVMISNAAGRAVAYALFGLQERGQLLVAPGTQIYEGMVVGVHSRTNDLVVNPLKTKQLTNIRAAGSDENILLTPPLKLTLERALTFIDEDELVEVTPASLRVRKRYLQERDRKRQVHAVNQ